MLTKTSLDPRKPKILKRSHPWGCTAINLLAFPGLGTVFAGRRIGYVQAALMLAGFFLVMGFMAYYFVGSVRLLLASAGDEAAWQAQYRAYAWVWQSGLAFCAVAWGWALISSLSILRQAGRQTSGVKPSS